MAAGEEWKREQLDFIEKMRGFQTSRSTPPNVQATGAYTRQASKLLALRDPCPCPVNNNGAGQTGAQPVKFENVTLEHDLPNHTKGSWFAAAVVNFINGFVRLYESERDFLDDQPVFSGCVRVPTLPRESYVQEILAFLERGHSLLNANCRCLHGLDAARCAELGISESGTGVRSGRCQLGFARLCFSGTEICNELGVSSVSVTDNSGKSVLESLESEARICCKHDALRNEPCYSFVYPIERVSCRGELLQLIEETALGVTAADKMQIYAGFESDMRDLGARGEIYYLYNSERKRGVGFKRDAVFGGAVDADILGLWKDAGAYVSGRGAREIERELYSLGIQATKVASVENWQLPLKRVKKAKTVGTAGGKKCKRKLAVKSRE